MHEELTLNTHPDAEALAAYLSGPAALAERQLVEDHLLICDACRTEVVAVRRMIRKEERRAWVARGSALAAAGIAAVILVGPGLRTETTPPNDSVLRQEPRTSPEGVARIEVRSPGDGVTISANALVFSWTPVGGEALYVLTVVDQAGDLVWEERTLEVSARWPRGALASPGQPLYWFVDALLDGNRSATSGVHEFRLR